MNFMTQIGVLAIILIILVILIKSNQTLEQIYMEGEKEQEKIDIPSFSMPEISFAGFRKGKRKEKSEYNNKFHEHEGKDTVSRSMDTIPMEAADGWYLEIVDELGRCFGRRTMKHFPFSIGRADDNDYVLDDLSVSGHHAWVEEERGSYVLVDRGSLNKITVGGTAVTRVNLVDRMEVALGNTRLRFRKEEHNAGYTAVYKKNSQIEEWY